MTNLQTPRDRTGYLPDSSELNGNGNGHENGKEQVFTLKKAVDPDTLLVLEARDMLLKDRRLNRPQQAFGCFLIDRALNPRFYDAKGVVCMADSIAAAVFGVTERTIYDWKWAVEEHGYFWITKKGRSNMWPMTTYHLACLHKRHQEYKTDADGTYGGTKVRATPNDELAAQGRAARNAALARKRAQKTLPLMGGIAVVTGSAAAVPEVKNSNLKAISAAPRKNVRLPAEANFGSEPKKISALSRRKLRPGAEENFGSEPKNTSGQSRSAPPPTAETDCGHIEPQIREKEGSLREGGIPPAVAPLEKQISEWRDSLNGSYPSRLEKTRTRLLQQRQGMRKSEARDVLDRKLAILTELLDGPLPAYEPPAKPVAKAAPEKPMTTEELLEGAEYLISLGKAHLLTPVQKKALAAAGK